MCRMMPCLLWVMCVFSGPVLGEEAWFRGNTHAHTVLCGHADSTPEAVAKWYHDRGYHFLVLSEHNKFIDPKTVKMPADRRKDFILIPGQEITGRHTLHTTAINTRELVPWQLFNRSKATVIQNHVHGAQKAGGEAILNHPNFHYAANAQDIAPVKGLRLFELFNGHPSVNNDGDAKHPSTEKIWDTLLTGGKAIFGVSSDDAHHFKKLSPDKSNPGRGWVMVRAARLEPDLITQAMRDGNFYASNGVSLKRCDRSGNAYVVEVDLKQTAKALEGNPLLRGQRLNSGKPGVRVQFIGPDGKVLQSVDSAKARFAFNPNIAYVRAKATVVREHSKHGLEAYHAWGQPRFFDGRDKTKDKK